MCFALGLCIFICRVKTLSFPMSKKHLQGLAEEKQILPIIYFMEGEDVISSSTECELYMEDMGHN